MAKKQATIKKPSLKEETKSQQGGMAGSMIGMMTGFTGAAAGTYKTYRKIRKDPTVALARMISMAPIRGAAYAIMGTEDTSPEIVEFIETEISIHWDAFLQQLLYALDYGWFAFEKVWAVKDNRYVFQKLKPLLVDITKIVVDKNTGAFSGVKNKEVELPPEQCFLFTYDGEAGNLYGRSRNENIRVIWSHYNEIIERQGKYTKKVAGVIPLIQYPEGTSMDKEGNEKSNFELAKGILEALGKGNGVCMPNIMAKFAGDLTRSGIDIDRFSCWFYLTFWFFSRNFFGSLLSGFRGFFCCLFYLQ